MKRTFWRLLYRLALRAEWLTVAAINQCDAALVNAMRLQRYATKREREAHQ
jgi:hypothetical protein